VNKKYINEDWYYDASTLIYDGPKSVHENPEHISKPIERVMKRVWAQYEKNNSVDVPASVRVLAEVMLALELKTK
jgi:hypothetical protein